MFMVKIKMVMNQPYELGFKGKGVKNYTYFLFLRLRFSMDKTIVNSDSVSEFIMVIKSASEKRQGHKC